MTPTSHAPAVHVARPLANTYKWRTNDGQHMLPSQMGTQHLVYSLRMLWNHLAPEELHIPGGKRWTGIASWPISYLKDSVENLFNEAVTRPDLTPEHESILSHLALYAPHTVCRLPDFSMKPKTN